MKKSEKKILVTSALPYANGPLHIGHIAGAYLPADIFVRYHRMKKTDVVHICGTDEHGVPITMKARAEKESPEEIVRRYHESIDRSFGELGIEFDHFSGTSHELHGELVSEIFLKLREKGLVVRRETEQYYCEEEKMDLPDRFVEGTCPACGFEKGRGDECPKCGKWLEAETLIDPKCKSCGSVPVFRKTVHWFLKLDELEGGLKEWLSKYRGIKEEAKRFLERFLEGGLKERAITRDIDWGVKVPLSDSEAKGKVIYVWFDALIGYITATREWAKKQGDEERWKDYWLNSECDLVHFLGKDNLIFHMIVWPGMLMGLDEGYILPKQIAVNEHLMIGGKKLSTSEGNVIWVDDFLKFFPADYLRYYLTCIAPEKKDGNFIWSDFKERINQELSNILGNYINRVLRFIERHFEGELGGIEFGDEEGEELISRIKGVVGLVEKKILSYEMRAGLLEVMELGHFGNGYFDRKKPWKLIGEDRVECERVLKMNLMIVKGLAVLIAPFLPGVGGKIWKMLNGLGKIEDFEWGNLEGLLKSSSKLGKIIPLIQKVEDRVIGRFEKEYGGNNEIEIKDFEKLELVVGKIKSCERVKGSKKLLKFLVDIGEERDRQIISGVWGSYGESELMGRQVIVLKNLKKAKFMGEESEGMILFAEDGGAF